MQTAANVVAWLIGAVLLNYAVLVLFGVSFLGAPGSALSFLVIGLSAVLFSVAKAIAILWSFALLFSGKWRLAIIVFIVAYAF